jgi:hypothetical protein
LTRCPLHPGGGCSLARHGTYERKSPPGTRIARWYCPQGHCTFSLLPDCLAARLPGTLQELEAVVAAAEHSPSRERASEVLRPDIELAGALRWLRRRLQAVSALLLVLRTLMADRFWGCEPTLAGFGQCLETEQVLVRLRSVAAVHLAVLAPPLGLRPPRGRGGEPPRRLQQPVGPDPPPGTP